MAEISKLKLPSGNVYDIKDAWARQQIAGGISFVISWNGTSTPVIADIPAGVTVTYNNVDYTGTMAASSAAAGTFYLVSSGSTTNNIYSEYVAIGTSTKTWEKLGDTTIDLSSLGTLAYKDNVTLSKGSGDQVLGEGTTFTAADSSVSFSGGTTDKCLGSDATFTTTVTPSTSKLVTTTVPNVTAAGSASSWSFAMGTDDTGTGGADESETLIISGANGAAPTLGTAITVATGSLNASASGASVATGITSASTTTNSKDEVTAVTGIGTGTAAAQSITVGTNDKVKVAVYGDLSVSVS